MAVDLLGEAAVIGDRLVADAVVARGRATWVGRLLPEAPAAARQKPIAQAAGHKIFDGTAGFALFLGELSRFTQDERHREMALAALHHAIHSAMEAFAGRVEGGEDQARFGFYSGATGVAWVAARLAPTLEDPQLAAQARSLVRRLATTLDRPAHDDLIFGPAGAIPALLALGDLGVEEAPELARVLGDRLVESAVEKGDVWSWRPMNRGWTAFLTGFSHGAAGFAYGLTALYAHTGDERYRVAALGALEYERSRFVHEEGNWADLRAPPDAATGLHRTTSNWCHGAPGIGLARVLMHPVLKDDRLLKEAEIAAAATRKDLQFRLDRPGSNFQLCHGIAGNAETLWLTEDALGVSGAVERARSVAAYGIARYGVAEQRRWETPFVDWPTGVPGVTERSLMKGLTGIGYYLLRLHAPREVPTILLPAGRGVVA